MLKFVLKRIIYLIPTLVLVAALVFLLIHMIPGDPAAVILGPDATAEDVASVRQALGLDRPLYEQFVVWLGNLAHGDFGVSIHSKRPVIDSIGERFPVTLCLTTLSLIFALIVALPSGVLAAVYHNTNKDYLFMIGTILGVSVPGFWLGLMALLVFSVQLGWFPSTGFVAMWEEFWEGLRYMILPAITLGLFMAAVVARMVRSSMLEVLRLEYVTHARAKGLSEWKVITKHALKNAFAPHPDHHRHPVRHAPGRGGGHRNGVQPARPGKVSGGLHLHARLSRGPGMHPVHRPGLCSHQHHRGSALRLL